jgi:aminoglycoside 6'-N-acetyltransferase
LTQKIDLRPLAAGDFPLLHAWFNSPHMQPYYMDPGAHMSEQELREKFSPRIDGLQPEKCFIAETGGSAYGYIQAYPNNEYAEISSLIGETQGVSIDYFIGEPDMLGKSLGSAMLREFQRRRFPEFFPNHSIITLHHDIENTAALRCSMAAGFQPLRKTLKASRELLVLKWISEAGRGIGKPVPDSDGKAA